MSVAEIVVVFVTSVAGFAMFRYGKKQKRGPQLGVGILLMTFPYFVTGLPWMLAVTGALMAGLWLAVRFGL